MNKDNLLKQLHRLHQSDPWVQQLFQAAGGQLDIAETLLRETEQQYFFDSATKTGLTIYERELSLKGRSALGLDDRRSAVSAGWKSGGKADLELLQEIADSWRNGALAVSFAGGRIHLDFVSVYGVPRDMAGLLAAIDVVKPAHLSYAYTYHYLLIRDIHEVMTLAEMDATMMDNFAGRDADG